MSSFPGTRIVPLGADRQEEVLELDQWAFAFVEDQGDAAASFTGFEWDRTAGVEVDGRLAGVHSVFSLRTPAPGGAQVPTAGLTWVGVHPQHRRRGLLTAMVRHHLHAVHEAGREPVSALWAAEPAIYGRFGYGQASAGLRFTLPRRAGLHEVDGTEGLTVSVEKADVEAHTGLVADLYDAVRARRPGMVSRDGDLARRVLLDPPAWRDGAERLRLLVVRDGDGAPRGYALFRRKEKWEEAGPRGEVLVREAHAVDAAATRVLWARLSDLDLMASVRTDMRPVDDPLVHLLHDVRATTPRVTDGLWVRLVDLPTALAARRYTVDVDVVLGVEDPLCPWNTGRWRLRGGPDGARCDRTSATADLDVDVRALGATWLGGQTLHQLAAAGRVVEHTPGSLERAGQAFAWSVAAYCGWVF
ncbi:GNAT family N-acetyltransferase [Kineosporiaceae bacterium SCSIO 59966]|nr:GNAT family N-acetyltransferase [Kineosporiaceae bacterium SCSIO 59966]